MTLSFVWKVTNYVATTATPSSDQIFCAQNKKLVFKETIAAFKRVNRFSKLISQIKIHEKTDILVYLDDLTKFFNIIFFAFKKKSIYLKIFGFRGLKKTIAALKRINGSSKLISQIKMHESTDILV